MRLSVADVDVLIALEATDALGQWRARLRTLEVVRAERVVYRNVLSAETEWRIELRAADGWRLLTSELSVGRMIELEAFVREIGPTAVAVSRGRLRVLVASLLRPELVAAQDGVDDAVCVAPVRDARGGGGGA